MKLLMRCRVEQGCCQAWRDSRHAYISGCEHAIDENRRLEMVGRIWRWILLLDFKKQSLISGNRSFLYNTSPGENYVVLGRLRVRL